MAKNLIKNIKNFVFQNKLWEREDKIIVGVSGGPDSVCLLNILTKLKDKYDFKIIIVHVNYNLRGKESLGDENFVRNLAKNYNLPIEVLNVKKNIKATEEKMRDIRYRFFEKVRHENNFDAITVAHNQDDQAETFLLRIIRGSGLAGLASMKAKNGHIIRPLLETPRKEIIDYLKRNKLKHRIDKSNREERYLRNRIRHSLIPYLEKKFNPNIKRLLANNAKNIVEDYDYISLEKEHELTGGNLIISEIKKAHPAQQNQIIREWIKNFKGNLKNISSGHMQEIKKVINSNKNKIQEIVIGNLKLIRKGDKLTILWKK
jgi:tRNA(Ile)-lysidine synthase